MGSVYFFLKTNPTFADKILCLLFAALGVWANFNLINFFIGIAGLQVLYALKSGPSKERQFWIQISLLITFSALVVILSMMRLMELKNNGQLYYGIDTLSGAFDSIVVWSLDLSKLPDNFLVFFRYAMASILVFSCAYFIWKKQLNSASAKMWVLIMAITIGLIAEHQFFAALYPQNRTALFIIPLLVLQIGHLINELVPKSTRQALISGFLLAALVAYPLTNQFLSRINGEGVGEWYYDASTKEAALRIYDETGGERVIVACNWMFKPAMQYYIQTRNLNFETIQSDHSEATEAKILYDFFSEEQNEKFNKSKTWLMNGGLTAVYFR